MSWGRATVVYGRGERGAEVGERVGAELVWIFAQNQLSLRAEAGPPLRSLNPARPTPTGPPPIARAAPRLRLQAFAHITRYPIRD